MAQNLGIKSRPSSLPSVDEGKNAGLFLVGLVFHLLIPTQTFYSPSTEAGRGGRTINSEGFTFVKSHNCNILAKSRPACYHLVFQKVPCFFWILFKLPYVILMCSSERSDFSTGKQEHHHSGLRKWNPVIPLLSFYPRMCPYQFSTVPQRQGHLLKSTRLCEAKNTVYNYCTVQIFARFHC